VEARLRCGYDEDERGCGHERADREKEERSAKRGHER